MRRGARSPTSTWYTSETSIWNRSGWARKTGKSALSAGSPADGGPLPGVDRLVAVEPQCVDAPQAQDGRRRGHRLTATPATTGDPAPGHRASGAPRGRRLTGGNDREVGRSGVAGVRRLEFLGLPAGRPDPAPVRALGGHVTRSVWQAIALKGIDRRSCSLERLPLRRPGRDHGPFPFSPMCTRAIFGMSSAQVKSSRTSRCTFTPSSIRRRIERSLRRSAK